MREWILTDSLTSADLKNHPVWEYVNDESIAPETAIWPVQDLPVHDLNGRLTGTQVRFHDGSYHWAILNNISLQNARSTKHFLGIWIEKDGRWFELARYHDEDFEHRSPAELAKFIGIPVTEIFPIAYDISQIADGIPTVIRGKIPEVPEEQLTEEQLFELALEK
jgi:hypothetical protein